ncbi:MAG: hypothetical protein GMKNLPBB_00536 [Myxococcota bacterium]|nr:hypothetical protein [Myxococcota bacterium]
MKFRRISAILLIPLLLLAAPLARAGDSEAYGAPLPPWNKKVGEGRYQVSSDWNNLLRWYRKKLPAGPTIKYRNIVNQPGIVAIHIENTAGGRRWDGVNLYKSGNEVKVYVLPAADLPPPAPGKKSDKK